MATSFGQWLKRRRTAAGLRQDELGARVACSWETIRKIEADTRHPSRQILELMAAVFNIPPDEREAFIAFARLPPGAPSAAGPADDDPAPWRALRAQRTNLPVPTTELIGREREVAAMA